MNHVRTIQELGKQGKVWEALDHLRASVTGCDKDVYLYGAAMKACGDAGKWREAVDLLHEMKMCGIQPNLVCYNTGMTACVKNEQACVALDLVRELIDSGKKIDAYTCSTALKAFSQTKQWKEALNFFRNMETKYGVKPNVYCFTATINALEKGGQWQMAVEMLTEMRNQGVCPTTITCTSVVSACKASSRWEEALCVLDYMREWNIRPDAHTFSNAICACVRAGQWEQAVTTFHSMERHSVTPTMVVYGAVLGAYEVGRRLPEALEIFVEMRQRGLLPDLVCYNALIGVCDSPSQAVKTFKEMCKDSVRPDHRTFKALINVCIHADELDAAVSAQKSAKGMGIDVDTRVLEPMVIRCLVTSRQLGWADKMIEEWDASGAKPKKHFYAQAGLECSRAGQKDRALQMWVKADDWQEALRFMELEGSDCGDDEYQCRCNQMLLAASAKRRPQEALAVLDMMIMKEVSPTTEAMEAASQACQQVGRASEQHLFTNLADLTRSLQSAS